MPGAGDNPTNRLDRAPPNLRSVSDSLTAEETDRLNASLAEDENRTAAQVITLLLLTGTRRREITLAKWEQVGEPGMRAACVAGTRPEIRILSRDRVAAACTVLTRSWR